MRRGMAFTHGSTVIAHRPIDCPQAALPG